jgi:hypothetical protein
MRALERRETSAQGDLHEQDAAMSRDPRRKTGGG